MRNFLLALGMLVALAVPASAQGVIRNSALLVRETADVLAAQRGTNPQTFRLYNTFTDSSNYERLNFTWESNVFILATGYAGTGLTRSMLIGTSGASTLTFQTNNVSKWQIASAGHWLAFADNTYDIGAVSATRPRTVYAGTSFIAPIVTYVATTLAALGSPANGTVAYCSDCAPTSAPCTGVSTGAIAKRLNGAWDCR